MATRREAMQVGAGGAFLGATGGAKAVGLGWFGSPPPSTTGIAAGASAFVNKQCLDKPTAPLMEHKDALSRLLKDVLFREKVRAEMYEAYRFSTEIDPDIAILKSLSPMAKITISRQRRVERELAQAFSFRQNTMPQPYSPWRDMISNGVQTLMWGER